ncbi:MAG: hypothetical protein WCJ19_00995 [bacterium]
MFSEKFVYFEADKKPNYKQMLIQSLILNSLMLMTIGAGMSAGGKAVLKQRFRLPDANFSEEDFLSSHPEYHGLSHVELKSLIRHYGIKNKKRYDIRSELDPQFRAGMFKLEVAHLFHKNLCLDILSSREMYNNPGIALLLTVAQHNDNLYGGPFFPWPFYEKFDVENRGGVDHSVRKNFLAVNHLQQKYLKRLASLYKGHIDDWYYLPPKWNIDSTWENYGKSVQNNNIGFGMRFARHDEMEKGISTVLVPIHALDGLFYRRTHRKSIYIYPERGYETYSNRFHGLQLPPEDIFFGLIQSEFYRNKAGKTYEKKLTKW